MSKGWYIHYQSPCQEALGANSHFSDKLVTAKRRTTGAAAQLAAACLLAVFALSVSAQPSLASRRDEIPDRLFEGQNAPEQIASARAVHDRLIPPPMEEVFFPTNFDGQAKVLNIDSTVNMTIAINQFYYNPKWRGEYWVPFDQVDLIERASRLMSSWREYNEANQYKVLNKVNIFFERYSGFGP
jgi:hypothetical protein